MIKLEGIVLNVFAQQGGQNKKGRNIRRPRQGANSWRYGTSQWWCENELFTLSVENYRDFKDYLNQKISIAVGAMASGRNVVFYVAKGALPELVTNS